MRFALYRHSGFFARGLNETEDFASAHIEPVFQVLHAMLGLRLKVFRVCASDGLRRQSIHMMVNIQIEWPFKGLLSWVRVVSLSEGFVEFAFAGRQNLTGCLLHIGCSHRWSTLPAVQACCNAIEPRQYARECSAVAIGTARPTRVIRTSLPC